MTDRIGKRLSVFNGAVRIGGRGCGPTMTIPTIIRCGLPTALRMTARNITQRDITDLLLRASAGRRDADEAIPSFAEARRIASTLAREKATENGRSAEELLALYEAENARLMQELDDVKAEHTEFCR